MARRQLGTVIEYIHASLGARDSGDRTDADLLERFVRTREEGAFTAILQRHGSLVIGVCRRVLGNSDDADDAFQATFLILVRKADSIRKSASVASWLYGVAHRVSLEARTRAARRRAHEKRAENMGHADPADDAAGRELRSILDQELSQLPQKYRDPLILHYLAGKTKVETAQQLDWSEGTVSGRLARARDLLRIRLIRRGLVLSGSALSAALAAEAAAASVSSILANSTVSLVTPSAVGAVVSGASTARILALTEGVVHSMFVTKLKIAVAVLLVVAAVGLGAAGLYRALGEQPPVVQGPPAPVQLGADPGALTKEPAPVKKEGTIFKAPDSGTLEVTLSADGKLMARGAWNEVVDVWDVATGKKLHTLKGHTAPVFKVVFSPDGKSLASAATNWGPNGGPGEMILWDLVTGKERATLKGLPGLALSMAFSPDGKTLATESNRKKETLVKLWDVDTGKEKLELKVDNFVQSLAFSPDGKTLAVGTGGNFMELTEPSLVILWDVTTGKERARTLPAHTGWISWVGFAPDGKTLASVSSQGDEHEREKLHPGQLKLWDVATAKERASIPLRMMGPLQFFSLAFTADGKTLISAMWSGGEKKEEGGLAVDHWDLATGKLRATFWAPFNAGEPGGAGTKVGIPFAALSADGKTVAWGGGEEKDGKSTGTAHVWDVQSLATSVPKLPKEPEVQPAKKPVQDAKPRVLSSLTEDVEILKEAGVATDGPGLAEFFRKNTLSDEQRRAVGTLIAQLGDPAEKVREKATQELKAMPVAWPALQQALHQGDAEIVDRAKLCLEVFEKNHRGELLTLAARVLSASKSEKAVEVLLAFLPSAADPLLEDEIVRALTALGVRAGKADPALVGALTDKKPLLRGAAAEALGQAGLPEHKQSVRTLLKDPEPSVRVRAALAMAWARDKEAVPVLIDLLPQVTQDQAWQIQDTLHRLAGAKAPKVLPGGDAAARDKNRAAWYAWWEEHAATVDLAQMEGAVLRKAKVFSTRASGSWGEHTRGRAFEGAGWNAGGFAPQWIEADLRASRDLGAILLVAVPSPVNMHEVWIANEPIGDDRTKAKLVHTFQGNTKDGDEFRFTFPKQVSGRYVQIRTTELKSSWVAWHQIELWAR